MVKRIFLNVGQIHDRREHVESRIFFEHAIGTKRHAVHNMAANNAIGRRKLDLGIFGKLKVVVNKERDKTVDEKTKKDDYSKNSRLPQISKWRKLACHNTSYRTRLLVFCVNAGTASSSFSTSKRLKSSMRFGSRPELKTCTSKSDWSTGEM